MQLIAHLWRNLIGVSELSFWICNASSYLLSGLIILRQILLIETERVFTLFVKCSSIWRPCQTNNEFLCLIVSIGELRLPGLRLHLVMCVLQNIRGLLNPLTHLRT